MGGVRGPWGGGASGWTDRSPLTTLMIDPPAILLIACSGCRYVHTTSCLCRLSAAEGTRAAHHPSPTPRMAEPAAVSVLPLPGARLPVLGHPNTGEWHQAVGYSKLEGSTTLIKMS